MFLIGEIAYAVANKRRYTGMRAASEPFGGNVGGESVFAGVPVKGYATGASSGLEQFDDGTGLMKDGEERAASEKVRV